MHLPDLKLTTLAIMYNGISVGKNDKNTHAYFVINTNILYLLFFCERSELLIWQVHQSEYGCIKLHTPYRYKVHPKLYSDWSMSTVF